MSIKQTNIPGLIVLETPLHQDPRGWFKEVWNREKMVRDGLPDFEPVQKNVSFNFSRGVTRGIHAEPWDKLISLSSGKAFCAWVDLRQGPTFGEVFTLELSPNLSVFVPRGVGNSYQTLIDSTSYSYLVNEHWRPGVDYQALNCFDPSLNIAWPIGESEAIQSEKDKHNPNFEDLSPNLSKVMVLGSGQLAKALRPVFPGAVFLSRSEVDFSAPDSIENLDLQGFQTVINAVAFTGVDAAEENSKEAWAINAEAVGRLASATRRSHSKFVHISSDYVFNGDEQLHSEEEGFSPINIYGASKAAGDLAAAINPNHLILRTSWVIGEGRNFINTIGELAHSQNQISVVSDQFGRPTFAKDLAEAIKFLVELPAVGTYNVTNSGDIVSWFDLAKTAFPDALISPVSSASYRSGKNANRPKNSALNMSKLESLGYEMPNWQTSLLDYLG